MKPSFIGRILAVLLAVAPMTSSPFAGVPGQKAGREEGEFRIFIAGEEIGTEKYVIELSADSASSRSDLTFRNPGKNHQKVHFETKLEMDGHYVPRSYELRSDMDGKKGSIVAAFKPNEALFEYISGGPPRRTGLVVGDKYTLLDTNIFHHFIFLARLFDFESAEKIQRFEVVIPQEPNSGFLNISELKKDSIVVRGKKTEAHQLQADSGSLRLQLWVDPQHVLYKIVVRDKDIEVVRNP